jgi:hypothetical protein
MNNTSASRSRPGMKTTASASRSPSRFFPRAHLLLRAVKRNQERFPPDFMFQLTAAKYAARRSTADRGGLRLVQLSLATPNAQESPMNAQATEALIEKLKSLPHEQRAEVEDFIDFLKARKERTRDAAAQRLGEAFKRLDALNQPLLTPEEVQVEIDAARAERRSRHSDRR